MVGIKCLLVHTDKYIQNGIWVPTKWERQYKSQDRCVSPQCADWNSHRHGTQPQATSLPSNCTSFGLIRHRTSLTNKIHLTVDEPRPYVWKMIILIQVQLQVHMSQTRYWLSILLHRITTRTNFCIPIFVPSFEEFGALYDVHVHWLKNHNWFNWLLINQTTLPVALDETIRWSVCSQQKWGCRRLMGQRTRAGRLSRGPPRGKGRRSATSPMERTEGGYGKAVKKACLIRLWAFLKHKTNKQIKIFYDNAIFGI